MKIGDLIKVPNTCNECGECWFCHHSSSRIGYVAGRSDMENMWDIIFDAGIWEVFEHELEVISESR